MWKVYAYSGCGTCRQALKFLREREVLHEVIAIREQSPSKGELERMLAHYGGEVRKLFNTSGQDYRALGLGAKLAGLTTYVALDLLAALGNLVKRPFVLTPSGGVVGFDAEQWGQRLGI
jgi:arsenate reductase